MCSPLQGLHGRASGSIHRGGWHPTGAEHRCHRTCDAGVRRAALSKQRAFAGWLVSWGRHCLCIRGSKSPEKQYYTAVPERELGSISEVGTQNFHQQHQWLWQTVTLQQRLKWTRVGGTEEQRCSTIRLSQVLQCLEYRTGNSWWNPIGAHGEAEIVLLNSGPWPVCGSLSIEFRLQWGWLKSRRWYFYR